MDFDAESLKDEVHCSLYLSFSVFISVCSSSPVGTSKQKLV
jgi:hypothetical protein